MRMHRYASGSFSDTIVPVNHLDICTLLITSGLTSRDFPSVVSADVIAFLKRRAKDHLECLDCPISKKRLGAGKVTYEAERRTEAGFRFARSTKSQFGRCA